MRAALSGRTALFAFALLVAVGGTNAVAVRLSNVELPPFWGAGSRYAAAALIFWLIALTRRIALPKGRALIEAILYGLLGTGASFAFLYWALLRVQASLAIVILALIPLITLFLAWAHGQESLSWRRLIGALIAIAGIVIVVGGGLGTSSATREPRVFIGKVREYVNVRECGNCYRRRRAGRVGCQLPLESAGSTPYHP